MHVSLTKAGLALVMLALMGGVALAQAGADKAAIPRLAPGPHMGMIEGFDDLSKKNRAKRASKLRRQAIKAGMSIGRVQIDWRDLETAPGVYDPDTLKEAIDQAGRGGMAVFVTFSSVDTSELTLPRDLTGPDGMVRDGLKLDGAQVMGRFRAFLDWFIPQLAARNVWGLALGNEVDNLVTNGVLPGGEVLRHLAGAVKHARKLDPDLAVTVTLSGEADQNIAGFTRKLVSSLDIVSFNVYCLRSNLFVNKERDWANVLKRWKKVAGKKQLFIQELGCPVGFGHGGGGKYKNRTNINGGSPALQASFIRYFTRALADDPQLRAATIFQLFDWSPKLASGQGDALRDAGEKLAGDLLEEWLGTVGLCRWSDGQCRAAWKTWKEGLKTLKNTRD